MMNVTQMLGRRKVEGSEFVAEKLKMASHFYKDIMDVEGCGLVLIYLTKKSCNYFYLGLYSNKNAKGFMVPTLFCKSFLPFFRVCV